MTDTADHVEDRLADFTRDRRILVLSLMAIVVRLTIHKRSWATWEERVL